MWAKPKNKGGLYIKGQRGNPVVRRALIKYAKWLRLEFEFPVKLPVYLSKHDYVKSRDGDDCVSILCLPFNKNEEPFIQVATGDYKSCRKNEGRDNVLASYLHDLTRNILLYHYWVKTGQDDLKGVNKKADAVLNKYKFITNHP